MIYAFQNGKKVHIKNAVKGSIGYDCWFNNLKVKACKGDYLQYWKYIDEHPNLPNGYENETDWHVAWKSLVKDEYCEVICGKNHEHRADIKTSDYVIELQLSHISLADAKSRTRFYKNLTGHRVVWVVNCYRASAKLHIIVGEKVRGTDYFELNWKFPKKWVVDLSELTDTNVYLDISNKTGYLLQIWKHADKLYCRWTNKQTFFNYYLKSIAKRGANIKTVFTQLEFSDYI